MPSGVDAALAVQPGTASETVRVVKDGGKVIAISGDSASTERRVLVEAVPHPVDVRGGMMRLMSDIEEGRMHVELERVYPFEDALAALAKVQARRARGKSVLSVRP